jgi:hypothetical protein
VVIERLCAGVWSEFWKGFFSYFDYKVDRDKCRLTFKPTVWDAYSPVFDQFDVERNILAAEPGQTVSFESFEWPHETLVYTTDYIDVSTAAVWHEYNYPPNPSPNEYYLYSMVDVYDGEADRGDGTFGPHYVRTMTYKRDVGFTSSNITPPGPQLPTGPWVVNPVEYSPGVFKWVRPIGGGSATTYILSTVGSMIITETLSAFGGEMVPLNGCITLKGVLEYFATFFKLTYQSSFFNDNPCPVGGDTLVYTMLQQISNLRDTVEVATKGIMTLKDLLEWIRDTFNAYLYIDSVGDFRIEHRRYFDYGLSYAYTHTIELDITATWPDNTLHLNQYEWSEPELFRFEKLDFAHNYLVDWVEARIEYKQLSIYGEETDTKSVEWSSDIISMYEQRNDLPSKGWVLLDCYYATLPAIVKTVRKTTGAITNISYENARFSSANILRDLWTFGRLLPEGYVNGALTTFDTIEKLRKQITLSFPQCCTDIDYNGLFRTELGDGIIDSAIYESSTGMLKINLIYE